VTKRTYDKNLSNNYLTDTFVFCFTKKTSVSTSLKRKLQIIVIAKEHQLKLSRNSSNANNVNRNK